MRTFDGRSSGTKLETPDNGELYVQIAAIEVDPSRLGEYRAAVMTQIKAAIQSEPGVLTLHAVANNDDPACIIVFEIYRDREAYEAHLRAAHFLTYKTKVESMVKSLTLTRVTPVALAAKQQPLVKL
ncbi:MAG TPA: antibiotic biosynthesis monooxygenase [bacterium]|nr:antibiotic biosynthesis monooxygenase [bacterium]